MTPTPSLCSISSVSKHPTYTFKQPDRQDIIVSSLVEGRLSTEVGKM